MYLSNLDQKKLDYLKGVFAQILYPILRDKVLLKAHQFTINPSNSSLDKIFLALKIELEESIDIEGVKEILEMLLMSLDEYQKDKKNKLAYKDYLQEADLNKRGEPIAFLSHLPSFCNIYARINLINNKKIQGINLVHDHQDHFDELIIEYKRRIEKSIDTNILMHYTSSDYYFTEVATLEFRDSKKSIGIQVADCLAGFSMRFLKNLSENNSISNIQWKSFCILQQQNIMNPALGTLIVCPDNIREKAFNYCRNSC